MNACVKNLNYKVIRACQRFLNVDIKCKTKQQWVEPTGYKTNLRIYNSATKCVTPLILKNKDILRWYACGPTVYDSAHIGHAITYVKSDIIRRILSNFFNINVIMVMCITDIDDKIIKRSKEEGWKIKDLTKHYEDEFFEDMKALNVLPPTLSCRVTDHMQDIIKFIENIVAKGAAYVAKDGSVYFDIQKYDESDEVLVPLQNTLNPNKKSQADFSLWKAAKAGEPSWESPWGFGRPGWHIECSAIASKAFGDSVDIHSGGVDLIFPHHKNEETQSCCHHGVDQWVNYWLHFGHLFLKGDVKMSKSLKNTISIQEYLKKYTANQFRMLCLLSDYRNGLEYSEAAMEKAVATLNIIDNFICDCDNYINSRVKCGNVDEPSLLQCLNKTQSTVNTMLADDFNTAEAVRALLNLVKIGNKMLHAEDNDTKGSSSTTAVAAVSNYVSDIISRLGVSKSSMVDDYKINNILEEFAKFRTIVRSRVLEQDHKDKVLLNACDETRLILSNYGIAIKDYKNNSTWGVKKY